MKRSLAFLIFVLSCVSSVFAQESEISSSRFNSENEISSEGIRVSLLTSRLNGEEENFRAVIKDNIGVAVGYAYLPVGEMGWTANAAVIRMDTNGGNPNLGRLDGNLAFAPSSIFNLKAGLNITNLQSKNPFGYQLGVGLQATENFGIDLAFVEMSEKFDLNDVDMRVRGAELAVSGTF